VASSRTPRPRRRRRRPARIRPTLTYLLAVTLFTGGKSQLAADASTGEQTGAADRASCSPTAILLAEKTRLRPVCCLDECCLISILTAPRAYGRSRNLAAHVFMTGATRQHSLCGGTRCCCTVNPAGAAAPKFAADFVWHLPGTSDSQGFNSTARAKDEIK